MMALAKIGNYQNVSISHPMSWGNFVKHATVKLFPHGENNKNEIMLKRFHISKVRDYPEAPTLRLPTNVSEIFGNETCRFTQERIRDIYSSTDVVEQFSNSSKTINLDSHVASYDCFGTVSLNSSMQTNVPKPFNSSGKSNYLNMPGGQWAQDGKYIAEDMQKSHYKFQLLKQYNKNATQGLFRNSNAFTSESRNYSTQSKTINNLNEKSEKTAKIPLRFTTKEKLQMLIKDYGKTIIVFHVSISLMSLGGFYYAISSGIDMSEIVSKYTGNNEAMTKILSETSTFTIAYTIHKLFAPVRIMMTLSCAPILVLFLRRKGVLRHPDIVKRLKETNLKNELKT